MIYLRVFFTILPEKYENKIVAPKGLWYVTLERTIMQVVFEFQKTKRWEYGSQQNNRAVKICTAENKENSIPRNGRRIHRALKTLTKLSLCVILQTVKDN